MLYNYLVSEIPEKFLLLIDSDWIPAKKVEVKIALWTDNPDLAMCLTELDVDDAAWVVTWHRTFVFGILFDTNRFRVMY